MERYTEYSQMPGGGNRIDPGYGPTTGAGHPIHYSTARQGFGWVAFATIVFMTVGVLNLIDGIVALLRASYLENALPIGDIATWAWVILALGVLQVIVAASIMSGRTWAKWAGIILCAFNLIAQMLYVRTYPVWSLLIIALDVVVIYGLAVYGGRRSEAGTYDVELTASAPAARAPQPAPVQPVPQQPVRQ